MDNQERNLILEKKIEDSIDFLEFAQLYRKSGFSIIPCQPRSKKSMIPWAEYQKRLPTEEEIDRWWEQTPNANIGIVLGPVSKIITVEVDDKESLKDKHIPLTPQATSGGKCLPHFYFRYPEGSKNYKLSDDKGRELFSIRCEGQYIIAPPSIHPSGNPYSWATGLGIHEVELADPPEWVLALVQSEPSGKHATTWEREIADGPDFIPEGGRNEFIFKFGCSLISRGVPLEQLSELLRGLNQIKCSPPLDDFELTSIIESVAKYEDNDQEPIPLPKNKVFPFPVEVLPYALQKVLTACANSIVCPVDYLALPLLSAAGVAIGNSRAIEIKMGWIEGPRIFTAVVAKPGSRKSPANRIILMPIYKMQAEMADEYEQRRNEYEKELNIYEGVLKEWQKSKNGEPKPAPPQQPSMGQIVTTDSTLEALASVLKRNPRGILYNSDELTGWVRSFNQYKAAKGADRQAWLSLWSGTSMVVNRKNSTIPLVIDSPFVGVTGGLPPDVLSDLIDERGREDGFIHRILFAYPDSTSLEWTEHEISSESFEHLEKAFRGLTALDYDLGIPKLIRFEPEAKRVWVEFISDHYREQEDPSFPDSLRGPWAKMEGYAARLALIIHMLRYVCDETPQEDIDAKSMCAAADLIDYFKSHTRRVYSELRSTPDDKKAEGTLSWIQSKGGTVTARDLQRNHVAGVKKSSEAKSLLKDLAERGHGTVTEGKNGNIRFSINN